MESIFQFLDQYFPFIMLINAFFFVSYLFLLFLLKFRLTRFRQIKKAFNYLLSYVVLVGEVALLVLTVVVCVDNLRAKKPLDFTARVAGTTEWVTDQLQIYFISGKELIRINANGQDRRVVFSADAPLNSYHFSPDGKYLAIVTLRDFFLYNRENQQSQRIDSWRANESQSELKYQGSIDGVAWSPQSEKICYRIGRWTKFSNRENWYIYQLRSGDKMTVKSPTQPLNELAWDQSGESLYFTWFDTLDKSISGNPFEIKVFQISLKTLTPEIVLHFPYDTPETSLEHLSLKGINIYQPAFPLSFSSEEDKSNVWVSDQGPCIKIDNQDQLVYVKNKWWRRRLFQVPRIEPSSESERYQYPGGRLAIQHLQWFPSARYVIMEHDVFGLLILQPATGKIGTLVNEKGNAFGWYPDVRDTKRRMK